MAQFEARTSIQADRAIVTLTGECDLSARDELTAQLTAAIERAPVVLVDLSGLEFLDSSGVHGLVTGHHTAQSRGRRLHLLNAVGEVAMVLDLTGVGDLLRPPEAGSGDA
jgi:anti-anti-sigma factor